MGQVLMATIIWLEMFGNMWQMYGTRMYTQKRCVQILQARNPEISMFFAGEDGTPSQPICVSQIDFTTWSWDLPVVSDALEVLFNSSLMMWNP